MPPVAKLPHRDFLKRAALEVLADGEEHSVHEIRTRVAAELCISRAALARREKGREDGANVFQKRMNNILKDTKVEGEIVNTRRGFYLLPLENRHPPQTEPGVNARIPDRPMGRDEYRKWLISELARLERM